MPFSRVPEPTTAPMKVRSSCSFVIRSATPVRARVQDSCGRRLGTVDGSAMLDAAAAERKHGRLGAGRAPPPGAGESRFPLRGTGSLLCFAACFDGEPDPPHREMLQQTARADPTLHGIGSRFCCATHVL